MLMLEQQEFSLMAAVHEAIKAGFFAKGGTPEQWERVTADPHKFNTVWNKLLNLPPSSKPPPQKYRNITKFPAVNKR